MLYFGSFNPIHNGHIALAEYVIEQGLCDMVTLIISPQSPYKLEAEQVAELARFEMAELACQGSKYPDRITPSAIEMLLEKPSYTINTLRYLEEVAGDRMEFSILMGGINLKRIFGDKACSIFIMPPSIEELRRRLEGRGTDSAETIEKRISKASFELTKSPEFDHTVINDRLEEAIEATCKIIDGFLQ